MRPVFYLQVPNTNIRALSLAQLNELQAVVAELGAPIYPLFLRLGNRPRAHMQPVTVRTLLAEIERFTSQLGAIHVPAMLFKDQDGTILGAMYEHTDGSASVQPIAATRAGIRLVLDQFPPPAGFRSSPGLKTGLYECFFDRISLSPQGTMGWRTAAMGGSGHPVTLPPLALPPATQWDSAQVAGKPNIAVVEWIELPADEAYRDALHALGAGCTDSLRLRQTLTLWID
ncbi:MAG: hypothetical protein ACM3XM_08425 [Mycobacterium leprae]